MYFDDLDSNCKFFLNVLKRKVNLKETCIFLKVYVMNQMSFCIKDIPLSAYLLQKCLVEGRHGRIIILTAFSTRFKVPLYHYWRTNKFGLIVH
jgi:hypothetical protein